MQNEGKKIFVIMLISILVKLLGFIREITMASVFGATSHTDAYLIATTIPLVIFSCLGESLSTTFIPMYSHIVEKNSKNQALKFMNSILNVLILATIILSVLGIIFTKPLVGVFAMGFKGETLELAIRYSKILLPGIILSGMNYIFSAYLQANKNFYVVAFIAIPKNIVIISSIILSHFWSKSVLVYGTLLAIASEMLYQLYFVLKDGYTHKIHKEFIDSHIKRLALLVMPVFLGMTVQQLNVLIDKTLASTLSEGSIAALNFAHRLDLFVFGVFTTPVIMVVYTMISQLAAKDDWKAFKDTIEKSMRYILLILIPVSIGAMCLATPIVRVLFERGHFDERATYMTSIALFYYSIGMTGSGLRIILSKAFYSLQDTKTPMLNGFMAMIANIVLNLILIKPMGHGGLALATSISSITGTVLLFLSLKPRLHSFNGRRILDAIIKGGLSSILMMIGVKMSYNFFSRVLGSGFLEEAASLFSCILLGGLIYFISIILMKVEEANLLITYLKRKIGAAYFVKGKLKTSKEADMNSISAGIGANHGKKLNLLLVGNSRIEDEESQALYHLVSNLSADKYAVSLAAAKGSPIAYKVGALNETGSSKVHIIPMPPIKGRIAFLYYLKILVLLYKNIKSMKIDIVHFHSFKLASLGCIIAWLLRVSKIFFTVHGWGDCNNKAHVFFQRLISRVSTNIICVSKFDLDKGIRRKWIYENNTVLIHYCEEKHKFRKKIMREKLKISKKIPLIGLVFDCGGIVDIVKIFNELKGRESKFALIMSAPVPLIEECEMYVNRFGLGEYAYVLADNEDASQLINDCDIFCYFSDQEKVPIVVIRAMVAQKTIIANDAGAISELVHEGRNGFIVDLHDTANTAARIESLLKSCYQRDVMGKNSRIIAYKKFRKDQMISEHELLYTGARHHDFS